MVDSNHSPIFSVECSIDSSLAEELKAIREKLKRLRLEKQKTTKLLDDRDFILDKNMKEINNRGQTQKMLQMELDRLCRLNQFQISSMKMSPIKSLREENQGGVIRKINFQDQQSDTSASIHK
ncbi:uncharacterized protein LOC124910610 [Impatiens glandulifera]|uniref:uncharacterized protein LOC124910610 n=1 Tax=Impatiens glandulifera TaxID=253017 RepID=UPI001FB093C4|nr:uncharacterized protein LOC124910610 [Impatiens glandulifera]